MGLLDSATEERCSQSEDGNRRFVPDPGELAQRLRDGEPAAVQEFIRLTRGGVNALLQRHLSLEQPQEEVQRVLAGVLRAVRGGELRQPQKLWEFVVARVRMHIADWKTRHPGSEAPPRFRTQPTHLNEMERTLRKLSARELDALRRFYLLNQPEREILAATGMTEAEWRELRMNCKTEFRRLVEGKPGMSAWAGQSRRRAPLLRSA